jgi:glutathione S-transferase
MIRLYNFELSGNAYKVRLMLSLLKLEHELVSVNLMKGEHKSPEFLKLNPLGQVPALTDGDVVIRDSQAILVYIARRYGGEDWLPLEAERMSKVVQWLSTAANDINQTFAAARRHFMFNSPLEIEPVHQKADQLLKMFDQHLQERSWLEFERPTIADIACFPYIGLAADGKISLEAYPHVVAWCDRIKQLPGYIGMPGL